MDKQVESFDLEILKAREFISIVHSWMGACPLLEQLEKVEQKLRADRQQRIEDIWNKETLPAVHKFIEKYLWEGKEPKNAV